MMHSRASDVIVGLLLRVLVLTTWGVVALFLSLYRVVERVRV
jgi:hypothetical protein